MSEAVDARPRAALPSFRPSPAVSFAIRFGVVVVAAIWIGKLPGLVESHSVWILITVLILMQPATGASLLKGLLRAVGTLAGAFTAIALFGLFAQDPPFLMAGLFVVQAVGAYGSTGPRFQYAWFVFAMTTAVVLGSAMAEEAAVETVAFERMCMVSLGILLVALVDLLFWPTRAEPSLRTSLAQGARKLGGELRNAITAQWGDHGAPPQAPGSGDLSSQLALARAAWTEHGVSRATSDQLARMALLVAGLDSRRRWLAQPVDVPAGMEAQLPEVVSAFNELAGRVAAALEEIADALASSQPLTHFSQGLEEALLSLEEASARLSPGSRGSAALLRRVADLRDLVAELRTMEATLSPVKEHAETETRASQESWRFRPDPFRMQIALRSGIAVLVMMLIPMALGWPINPLVAPVAFTMAATSTRGEAFLTAFVVLIIMALSWTLADLNIVFVSPYLQSVPLAMLPPFAVAATLAYIAASKPQLAILSSIGGLVALLPVYGGTAAPTDVYGSYSTICYLALAIFVGWVFTLVMWPATAATLFRERVASELEACRQAFQDGLAATEVDRSRRAAQLRQRFSQAMLQIGPLHAQAIHEPVERGLDETRREKILVVVTDLVDAIVSQRPRSRDALREHGGASVAPLLEAVERVDEALLASMQNAIDMLRGQAPRPSGDLAVATRAVETRLEELRGQPGATRGISDQEKLNLLVYLDVRRMLVTRQRAIEDAFSEWWHEESGEVVLSRTADQADPVPGR